MKPFNVPGVGQVVIINEDPPVRKESWISRHSEIGNCTLHFSKPFMRPPLAPIYKHPKSPHIIWMYSVAFGLCTGTSISWAFLTPIGFVPLLLTLFGPVYVWFYRHGLPYMAAEKFRERIHGQVPFA
jgi:hypothetical protein